MNKYSRWYEAIIDRARPRKLDGYKERHHIIPRSLGGNDSDLNLVDLTAREHFICHWLLVKMHTGLNRGKMINALVMMRASSKYQDRYINGRVYEHLRKEYSEYISKMNTGRIQPMHEKVKQKLAQTGRKRKPFSEEWKNNMSKAQSGTNNPMFGKTHSEETRQKISQRATNRRKETPDEIERRIAKIRGRKREKKFCQHCEQHIAVNTYPRFHGDKCKVRPI